MIRRRASERPARSRGLLFVLFAALAMAAGAARADGIVALQSCPGYRTPGTNTVSCQFAWPATNQLLSLLWRPQLPAGWALAGVSGDAAPEQRSGDILFSGAFPSNRTVVFQYTVTTPAGQPPATNLAAELEYQFSGMTNPATARATPDPLPVSRLQALEVRSLYGVTAPSGTNFHVYGAGVVCTLSNTVVASGLSTQYVSSGWSLAGQVDTYGASAGAGSSMSLALTNDATLSWRWTTNYWLDTGVSGSGAVTIGDGWRSSTGQVSIGAVAATNWHFVQWTGTTNGCVASFTNIAVPMTGPRTITAAFAMDVPAAPAGVTASDGDYTNRVAVSWSAALNAASYRVYRNVTNNSATATLIGATGGLMLTDSNAVPETLYYYWIKATNTTGSSAFSGFDTGFAHVPVTRYVRAGSTTPAFPYTSWGTAASAIQDAVDAAQYSDTVLASNGTYTLSGGIVLAKAVALRSVNGAAWTVVDGNSNRCFSVSHGSALVEGFTVKNGFALGDGGGILLASGTVQRCTIVSNEAGNVGGGICVLSGQVLSCEIGGNRAWRGGGLSCAAGVARNCLVTRNTAATWGGGVLAAAGADLANCTVADNSAGLQAGGLHFGAAGSARNLIVYFNSSPDASSADIFGTTGNLSNCCSPAIPQVSGNVTNAPLFVDRAGGDYRLGPGSPCIDAGLFQPWMSGAKDLAGNSRVYGGAVDAGAYESLTMLSVASPRGNPAPPSGLFYVTNGASVACSLAGSPAAGSPGVRFVCTGWSGSGSVPGSGSTTNAGLLTIATNSSITWLWATQCNLTASSTANGYTVGSNGWYSQGASTSVLAVASNGYHFTGWTGDVATNANPLVLTLDRPWSVTATFAINVYSITAGVSTAGGSIAPSGIVSVPHGSGTNFLVIADLHYHVQDVVVDGASVGATSAYAFASVTTNRSIRAAFALDTHRLTVASARGGAVPPAGTNLYPYGSTVACAVTNSPVTVAGTQYVCTAWSLLGNADTNGLASGAGTNVTLTLTNDAALAWAWQTNVLLTVNSTSNGTASVGSAWYVAGSAAVVTATPSVGYHFGGWSGTLPAAMTNDNPLALPMDQSRVIAPRFDRNIYSITATAEGAGSIAPSGTVQVTHGAGTNFTISANVNNHIMDVEVDGASVGATNAYTFANVTGNRTIKAKFAQDASFTLDVASPHGTAVPPVGRTAYFDGNTAVCSVVDSPVIFPDSARHTCTGWVGTGSIPLAGVATNFSAVMRTNSTLTWKWATEYWLGLETNGSGTVSAPAGWWQAGVTAVLTAAASPHWHFTGWSGSTNGCTATATNRLSAPMSAARQVGASFAIDTQTLQVVSIRGVTDLPTGIYARAYGTVLTNRVAAPAIGNGQTQYVCTGWTMTGNVPLSGATNLMSMTLTNNAVLTWNWGTNYWLDTGVSGAGSVDVPDGWYARGSNVVITATPTFAHAFSSWMGDTAGCAISSNRITVPLTRSRAITAAFVYAGRRLYVDAGAAGAGDGTSWSNAYPRLQDALAVARELDELWVADGLYLPGTNRTDTFQLAPGTAVYGGFSGTETNLAQRDWVRYVARLSGDLTGDDAGSSNRTDNALHVVTGAGRAILDGFQIAGGVADGTGDGEYGGGVILSGVTNAAVAHCTFRDNHALTGGGALDLRGSRGITVSNCVFELNAAGVAGGALSVTRQSQCEVKACVFAENSAELGGAVFSAAAALVLENSILTRNSASRGGGLRVGEGTARLQNCTVAGNAAALGGGISGLPAVVIRNSVVWGNGNSLDEETIFLVDYSLVEGGHGGLGNLAGDPLFVASGNVRGGDSQWLTGDDGLRLRFGSPCLDSGSASNAPSADIAGVVRPQGTGVDLGAYECTARLIRVDARAAGTGDGASWANAMTNLVSALAGAASGSEMWVAEGRYVPGAQRTDSFRLKDGMALYGGFAGTETARAQRIPGARETTLSGDLLGNDAGVSNMSDNAYHVVVAADNAVFDGFSVEGGNADGSGDAASSQGGGLYSAAPAFAAGNCVFRRNVGQAGGAIFGRDGALLITNSVLVCNIATNGAGLCSSNSAAMLADCTFADNRATATGGGVASMAGSTVTVVRCTLAGNAARDGAALAAQAASLAVTRCELVGNLAATGGAGGGIHCSAGSTVSVESATLRGNGAGTGGGVYAAGGSSLTLGNSIVWSNTATLGATIYSDGSTASIEFCSLGSDAIGVNGSSITTVGATSGVDPFFADGTSGTWSSNAVYATALQRSTLTDAGKTWTVNELAGKYVRPQGGRAAWLPVISNGTRTVTVWGNLATNLLAGASYEIADLHLKSTAGRWARGRGTWINDTVTSPCVDAGRPVSDWSAEPVPNGSRINLGADGNSAESSKSGVSVVGTGVSGQTAVSASLQGWIPCVGGQEPSLYVYWGTTDGGTVATGWQNTTLLSAAQAGAFAAQLTSLTPGTTYYYRFWASNSMSQAWAPASGVFTTAPAVVYVDWSAVGAGNGSSWANAFTNLQTALGSAVAGQQVRVAQGTYIPGGSRTNSFLLPESVTLAGGFTNGQTQAVGRDWRAHSTILSGDAGAVGTGIDNHYHVVRGARDARLEGCVVRDGYADGAGENSGGGGLLFSVSGGATATLTVAQCLFTSNVAVNAGGGVLSTAGAGSAASIALSDCAFESNAAPGGTGGGMSARGASAGSLARAVLDACTFSGNAADSGGGLAYDAQGAPYRLELRGCLFTENRATNGIGGGLFAEAGSAGGAGGVLDNCTFLANVAAGQGGGAGIRGLRHALRNSRFLENSSGMAGGGLWMQDHGATGVVSCVFAGNSADIGGGLFVHRASPAIQLSQFIGNRAAMAGGAGVSRDDEADCRPAFLNCTFSGNRADVGGGLYSSGEAGLEVRAAAANCIFWNNGVGEVVDGAGAQTTVRYSCVQGGFEGDGNVDEDPLFTGGSAGLWTAGAATATSAGQSVLTDAGADWLADHWEGLFLTPDRDGSRVCLVVSNGTQDVTVWGRFLTNVTAGTEYQFFDYRLGSTNSPCIDGGINVGLPYIGAAPDMGASEWGSLVRLRVYLQGAFDTNTDGMVTSLAAQGAVPLTSPYAMDRRSVNAVPTNVTDWVLAVAVSTNDALLSARSVFVRGDGWLVDDSGNDEIALDVAAGTVCRIAVQHRNHLAVLSAAPLDFGQKRVSYDFTTGSNRYFGGAAAAVELRIGRWAMIAGDADGDGFVGSADAAIHASQLGLTGYRRGDCDLGGLVTSNDAVRLLAPNYGRESLASYNETILAPALTVTPAGVTLPPAGTNALSASGSAGPVLWTFVDHAAGGTLATAGATSVLYTAGANTGRADLVEAWDTDNRLGRAYANVIDAAEFARAGKAVLIAGWKGGGDPLWPTTRYLADVAYNTLLYRGYAKDNMRFISPEPSRDVDANGRIDDIAMVPTLASVAQTFTNWAGGRGNLFIYLVDHGGESLPGQGYFRLNSGEALSATQLNAWVDAIQAQYSNQVTIVVDCCQAGSFLDELSGHGASNRIVIAACSSNEPTWFLAGGLVSFSDAFFSGVMQGYSLGASYNLARDTMRGYQNAVLDDNGDGLCTDADGALANTWSIGSSRVAGRQRLTIGSISGDMFLSGVVAARLWADDVVAPQPVERVWCQIRPPGVDPDPATPVSRMVEVELPFNAESGRYEALYGGFSEVGTNRVIFYARDVSGAVSDPRTCVIVQEAFEEKAVLVAAGSTNSASWPRIRAMGNRAYRTLRDRGFAAADIRYLSPEAGADADGDGQADVAEAPSLAALVTNITDWAASANKLTVYLAGESTNAVLPLDEADSLGVAQLDSWLDGFQRGPSEVSVVLEFQDAGSFLAGLTPPRDRTRIVLAAASNAGVPCLWANDGQASFSSYFFSGVQNGATVGAAFESAREAVWNSSGPLRQEALMDDDGDGKAEASDGEMAAYRYIGRPFVSGVDAPLIEEAMPETLLVGTNALGIWIGGVTDMDGVSNAWCFLTPPDYDGASDLLRIPLAFDSGSARFVGVCSNIVGGGANVLTFHAADNGGRVSPPAQAIVLTPDAFETDEAAAQGAMIAVGAVQSHNFHASNDVDWVRFWAESNSVYELTTLQRGDGADTALELWREGAMGALSFVSALNASGTGAGLGESLTIRFDASAMYCLRVSSTNGWGAGSTYDLRVNSPAGGDAGQVIVIVGDVLRGAAVSNASVTVDGISTWPLNGKTSVSIPSLSPGYHYVQVNVPSEYRSEEDPNLAGQVGNPLSSFGNPRWVYVYANQWVTPEFRFIPCVRLDGLVKNAWTDLAVDSAELRFTATSGAISGLMYNGYPNSATYKSVWLSKSDGAFPTNVYLPDVNWDMTLVRSGYQNYAKSAAVVSGGASKSVNTGSVRMVPLDYALTVQSPWGSTQPAVGTNYYAYGSSMQCAPDESAVVNGTTQYVCRGWSGSGSAPATGATASCQFVLTNASAIAWLWKTNFYLGVSVSGGGSVDWTGGWVGSGSNQAVTATDGAYYRFQQWSGDTSGCVVAGNRITATMTAARQITAVFSATTTSNGVPQWWLAAHGLTNGWETEATADQDLDRLLTWQEWIAGTDPTDAGSVFSSAGVASGAGGLTLTWWAVSGRTYQVYANTGLTGGTWDAVGAAQPAIADDWMQCTDTNATSQTRRFYRVDATLTVP